MLRETFQQIRSPDRKVKKKKIKLPPFLVINISLDFKTPIASCSPQLTNNKKKKFTTHPNYHYGKSFCKYMVLQQF